MPKYKVPAVIVSNQVATVTYGIATFFTGVSYFYFAKDIRPLLPSFTPKGNAVVYLIGVAFILAGIAITINRSIARLAGYLLSLLLFGVAIVIDLRGVFNLDDSLKYLFV